MFERFDFDTYRGILRWITDERPCVSFPEAADLGAAPFCLVRHDIDFSLSSALRIAQVEAEMGVKATYFLLLSAPHYNLLTPENSRMPRALTDLGHEVGLHYDSTTVADLPPDEGDAVLRAQAALLGTLSGGPVTAIARHNPGFGGVDPMEHAEGFLSAYDPRFTSEITYVSDSCGAWREEGLAVLGAAEPPPHLQLLVHPLFWDARGVDRWTHLERLRGTQLQEVEDQIAVERQVWIGHPAVGPHDARVRAAQGSGGPPQS